MSKKISALFLVERTAYLASNFVRVKKLAPLLREAARADPFVKGAYLLPIYSRREGGFPVRAFLQRDDAEAFARREEKSAWDQINPFYYGDALSAWTSFDHGRLCDWLLDIGLEPPEGKRVGPQAWRAWYDGVRPTLTALHLLRLREALDRVRLYRVAELTEDGTYVDEVGGRFV